jgi:hypothetical protein
MSASVSDITISSSLDVGKPFRVRCPKNLVRLGLSRNPVVSVMQPADLGPRNDASEGGGYDSTPFGSILT